MWGLEETISAAETSSCLESEFNKKVLKTRGEGSGMHDPKCTPQPAAAESGQLNPEEKQE